MNEYFAPIATILATFIGGGWLFYIHWLNMRRTARAEFISSIFNILEGVYPVRTQSKDDIENKLREAQPKLQRAISIFRYHIPKRKRAVYDKAWKDYSDIYYAITDLEITSHDFYNNDPKDIGPYGVFCKHISTLLSFTE